METSNKKLELIEWLIGLSDNKVIDFLNSIKDMNTNTSDWWDTLSKQQKESINQGLKDIEEGRVHSHESVMKTYEKRL